MASKLKCPVPSILLCIVGLILTTVIACYFIFKLQPTTAPTTFITNPTHETKAEWVVYDSSGTDASAKDTRFDKDSMMPFAWRNFTIEHPADWHFTETMNYYAESPMPDTSFYDDKGDFKLAIIFGSNIVQPDIPDTEEVRFGGNTFYRYETEAKRAVYIFKSGTDNEIFMGTAVQIDFELADTEAAIAEKLLSSFALSEAADHSTYNLANIELNANPCIGTPDGDTDQATRNAIKDFYDDMTNRNFGAAAALLSGESGNPFGSMFGICSAYHTNLAAIAGQNGVILLTSSGNGLPSVPNDTYHFGYLTAEDEIVTLHEEPIDDYFGAAVANRYQAALEVDPQDMASASDILKQAETRTKAEFLSRSFSNPEEQVQFEDFVAKYDSIR